MLYLQLCLALLLLTLGSVLLHRYLRILFWRPTTGRVVRCNVVEQPG